MRPGPTDPCTLSPASSTTGPAAANSRTRSTVRRLTSETWLRTERRRLHHQRLTPCRVARTVRGDLVAEQIRGERRSLRVLAGVLGCFGIFWGAWAVSVADIKSSMHLSDGQF